MNAFLKLHVQDVGGSNLQLEIKWARVLDMKGACSSAVKQRDRVCEGRSWGITCLAHCELEFIDGRLRPQFPVPCDCPHSVFPCLGVRGIDMNYTCI